MMECEICKTWIDKTGPLALFLNLCDTCQFYFSYFGQDQSDE
jgi:hypothetical protein